MNTEEILREYEFQSIKEILSVFVELEEVSGIKVSESQIEQTFMVGKKADEKYLQTITRNVSHKGHNLGKIDIYFSSVPIKQKQFEMFSTLLLEAIFLLILFIGLFVFISKKYAKPIQDLSNIIKHFKIGKPNIPEDPAIKTNIDEIQEIFHNYSKMAREVAKNYSQLEQSNLENKRMTKKLAKIIDLSEKFDKAAEMSEKSFMKQLFRNAFEITPEADYGSVYFYKNGFVEFVDAIGHDIKRLKKLKIPEEFMRKDENGIISDGKNAHVVDFQKKWRALGYENHQDLKALKQASKEYKQTLFFELFFKGELIGGLNLDIAQNSERTFSPESIEALNAFRNIAGAFYKIQHYSKMKETFTRDMMLSIIKMLEIHDNYTKGHSENVATLSSQLAKKLNLSNAEQSQAYWAGLVHDIGKILIPDAILNKDTRLTVKEFEFIKKHPVWGYETLKSFENLSDIAVNVLYHHESWDGKGYPEGLQKNEIPYISRIICIADSWDAMTSKRAYRKPMTFDEAIEEIKKNAGKQFDPEMTGVFLKMMLKESAQKEKKEHSKIAFKVI